MLVRLSVSCVGSPSILTAHHIMGNFYARTEGAAQLLSATAAAAYRGNSRVIAYVESYRWNLAADPAGRVQPTCRIAVGTHAVATFLRIGGFGRPTLLTTAISTAEAEYYSISPFQTKPFWSSESSHPEQATAGTALQAQLS